MSQQGTPAAGTPQRNATPQKVVTPNKAVGTPKGTPTAAPRGSVTDKTATPQQGSALKVQQSPAAGTPRVSHPQTTPTGKSDITQQVKESPAGSPAAATPKPATTQQEDPNKKLQQLLEEEEAFVNSKKEELEKLHKTLTETKDSVDTLTAELSSKANTHENEISTIKAQDEALTLQIKSSIELRQSQLTTSTANLKVKRDEKTALDNELLQVQKRHKSDCDAREKSITTAKDKTAADFKVFSSAIESLRSDKATRLTTIKQIQSSYATEISALKKELAEGKDAASKKRRSRKSGPTLSAPAIALTEKHEDELEKRDQEIKQLEDRLKKRTAVSKKLKSQIESLSLQDGVTQADVLNERKNALKYQKEKHCRAMEYLNTQLENLKKVEGWSEEQMTEQMKKEMEETVAKSKQTEESCKDDLIVNNFKAKIESKTTSTETEMTELNKQTEAFLERSKTEATSIPLATDGLQEVIDSLKSEIKKSEETLKSTEVSIKQTQRDIKTATAKLVLADPKTRHHLAAPPKGKVKRTRSPSPESKTKRKGKH